jgi:hypothetical protein
MSLLLTPAQSESYQKQRVVSPQSFFPFLIECFVLQFGSRDLKKRLWDNSRMSVSRISPEIRQAAWGIFRSSPRTEYSVLRTLFKVKHHRSEDARDDINTPPSFFQTTLRIT